MVEDYNKGGLRAPSIETMAKSLKLAWISRFLKSIPTRDDESWKVIPNHFLDKYGGLNFLLRCNYDKNFLDKMCLPYFYKLILLHFLELKISYNTQFCRFVLFNNKDILIGGRSFFYRSWMNKNVFLVQDLLGDDGKVLSYSEFLRKFRLNGNFLQYMQVVSASPKDLIDDARRYHIDKNSILSESSFQLSADLSLYLLKMKNRNYFWLLISEDQHEISANMKWQRDLFPEIVLARHHFSRVKNICRDNKPREF